MRYVLRTYVRVHYINCTSKLKLSTHKKSLRVDIYLICLLLYADGYIFCLTFFYSICPKIVVTTYTVCH